MIGNVPRKARTTTFHTLLIHSTHAPELTMADMILGFKKEYFFLSLVIMVTFTNVQAGLGLAHTEITLLTVTHQ